MGVLHHEIFLHEIKSTKILQHESFQIYGIYCVELIFSFCLRILAENFIWFQLNCLNCTRLK